MKYEIEVYKGQTIEYDDDADKFICEMSIEDRSTSTKRMSLGDVRKAIDSFIKLNVEFKPFKALFLDSYDKDFREKEVVGLRTDGKFIIADSSSYKSHYGKKEMSRAMEYDYNVVQEKKRLDDERENYIKEYRKSIVELCNKLKPMDLSKYDAVVNPE